MRCFRWDKPFVKPTKPDDHKNAAVRQNKRNKSKVDFMSDFSLSCFWPTPRTWPCWSATAGRECQEKAESSQRMRASPTEREKVSLSSNVSVHNTEQHLISGNHHWPSLANLEPSFQVEKTRIFKIIPMQVH